MIPCMAVSVDEYVATCSPALKAFCHRCDRSTLHGHGIDFVTRKGVRPDPVAVAALGLGEHRELAVVDAPFVPVAPLPEADPPALVGAPAAPPAPAHPPAVVPAPAPKKASH